MKIQLNIPRLPPLSLPPLLARAALFDLSLQLLGILFALFAVYLASRWLTQLTAPRPIAKLPSTAVAIQGDGLKFVSKLFGTGDARVQPDESLQLAGVFAGVRGGGFATFNTRKGAISVFVGDEVMPGVRLEKIESDRVILISAGTRKELPLRPNAGPAAQPPQMASLQAQQQVAATPQQPVSPAEAGLQAPRGIKPPRQKEDEQ